MTVALMNGYAELTALADVAGALLVKARATGCDGPPLAALELALEGWRTRRAAGALITSARRAVGYVARRGLPHLTLACRQVEGALGRVDYR